MVYYQRDDIFCKCSTFIFLATLYNENNFMINEITYNVKLWSHTPKDHIIKNQKYSISIDWLNYVMIYNSN